GEKVAASQSLIPLATGGYAARQRPSCSPAGGGGGGGGPASASVALVRECSMTSVLSDHRAPSSMASPAAYLRSASTTSALLGLASASGLSAARSSGRRSGSVPRRSASPLATRASTASIGP